MASGIRLVMECTGLPPLCWACSLYTVLVRDLGLGRCILSASAALAIMILPFIEVRAEKAFRKCRIPWCSPPMPWDAPKLTPFVRWYFRPAGGTGFWHDSGRLLCHGSYGAGYVHGSGGLRISAPQSPGSAKSLPLHLVSAAVPGSNLHACGGWDSICDDGADSSGKYGGGCLCGALSERVGKVQVWFRQMIFPGVKPEIVRTYAQWTHK